jgi:hypothetical protein
VQSESPLCKLSSIDFFILTNDSAVDTGVCNVHSSFVCIHSYAVGYPPGILAGSAPNLRFTLSGPGTALNVNSPRGSDCAPRTVPSENSPRFMPLKMHRAAGGMKLSLFVGSF